MDRRRDRQQVRRWSSSSSQRRADDDVVWDEFQASAGNAAVTLLLQPPERSSPHGAPPSTAQARTNGARALDLQRRAGNRAVSQLLTGTHTVRHRPDVGGPTGTAGGPTVQGDFFDDIASAVSGVGSAITGAVKAVGSALGTAGAAAGTALNLASQPPCDGPVDRPSLSSWLDDPGLESIRHDGKLLSQSSSPAGSKAATTKLVKTFLLSWGCDKHGRNMLAKYGANTVFGAETANAVKAFQLFALSSPDGKVGPSTLEAMDQEMGVRRTEPPDPSSLGGDTAQAASVFLPASGHHKLQKDRIVARIYFPTDSAELDPDDLAVLAAVAGAAEDAVDLRLQVDGFADKREFADHNDWLSVDRSVAAVNILAEHQSSRELPLTMGFEGHSEIERPQPGGTAEELKAFRRVDIVVSDVTYPEAPAGSGCGESPRSVDVHVVSLPGAATSPAEGLRKANAVWNQCTVSFTLAGAETWDTNVLDQGVLKGVLETPDYPAKQSAEEAAVLAHRPGGKSAVHVYLVPEIRPATYAQSYWSARHGLRSIVIEDGAPEITLAHELGHILLDTGEHWTDKDNLMAQQGGSLKGVLDCEQCRSVVTG